MSAAGHKLLFDENISYRVVKQILHLFPDSQPANRLKLVSKEDGLIWAYAKANDFTIITYDEDYEELSQLRGWPPKVILLRTGNLSNQQLTNLIVGNANAINDFLNDQDFDARGLLKLFRIGVN